MTNIAEINILLERNDLNEYDLIKEVDSILHRMDVRDQLDMHGALTQEATNRLYAMLNKLTVDAHVREHITWAYFKQHVDGLDTLSNERVQEMLNVYREYRFLAVESLFIELLKKDALSLNQLHLAEQVLSGKSFLKESMAFKCRHRIRTGDSLNATEVSQLIQFRAYATLEFALDRDAVTIEGLDQFVEPESMEQDRKIKLVLFQKASKRKAE